MLSVSSVVILFSDLNMFSYIVNLTTELPTWIFLFAFLYLLCSTKFSVSCVILLGLIAGLSVNFRPNQSPGWVYLLFLTLIGLVYFDKNRLALKRTAWLFVLAAIFSISLSLLHNLYYGNSFVLFSSSGAVAQKHSWKIFFDMFFDADSRKIVLEKLRSLTMFSPLPLPKDKYWPYSNAFQLMHIVWLLSLLFSLRISRQYLKTAAFALVPFSFLVPMVVYDGSTYFPRHIVIINLAFLFSAVLMVFNVQKSNLVASANR